MADSEHVSSSTPLFGEEMHHYQAEPGPELDQPKQDLFSVDDIVDLVGGAQDALHRHLTEDSAPHEYTEEEPVTLLEPEPVLLLDAREPEPEPETLMPDSTSFSFIPDIPSFIAEEPKVVAPKVEPESTQIDPEPEPQPEPEPEPEPEPKPAPQSDALPAAEPSRAAAAPAEAAEQPAVKEEAPAPASYVPSPSKAQPHPLMQFPTVSLCSGINSRCRSETQHHLIGPDTHSQRHSYTQSYQPHPVTGSDLCGLRSLPHPVMHDCIRLCVPEAKFCSICAK